MAEATYSLELWRGQIKNIEGKFGTGVTSYFMLLKFLFLLNVPVFLLSFGLLVLPMILYRFVSERNVAVKYDFKSSESSLHILLGRFHIGLLALWYLGNKSSF